MSLRDRVGISPRGREKYPNSYKWVQQPRLGDFPPESASQERRSDGSEVELGGFLHVDDGLCEL